MRRRLLRKPFLTAGVVVIVVAGTGAFFLTRGAASSLSYRTAAATLGTVTQTVSKASSGAVAARILTISPAGANGCTAGFGGGFGRGGGFGGGGFGGGGGGGSSAA